MTASAARDLLGRLEAMVPREFRRATLEQMATAHMAPEQQNARWIPDGDSASDREAEARLVPNGKLSDETPTLHDMARRCAEPGIAWSCSAVGQLLHERLRRWPVRRRS